MLTSEVTAAHQVPQAIKQMLRITFAYLTVYSVSSYRFIHPDEMKGSQLLFHSMQNDHRSLCVSVFFGWFAMTDLTDRLSFNRYSMCLILFLFTCFPSPCQTSCTMFVPCMSSQSACLRVYVCVCVCVSSVQSLVIMFCVCALLYELVGDRFLSL